MCMARPDDIHYSSSLLQPAKASKKVSSARLSKAPRRAGPGRPVDGRASQASTPYGSGRQSQRTLISREPRAGLRKCTNPRKHAVLLARGRHPPWPFALALPPRQEPELLPAARTSLVVVANRQYPWASRCPLLHARIWFLWPMWQREQVPERNIEGLSGVPRRAYKFDQTALQESSGRPKSGNLSAAVVHNTSGPLNRTAPM